MIINLFLIMVGALITPIRVIIMIKRNILAIVIPPFLAGTVNAIEVYNKDGNKIDLYAKVDVRHFFGKTKAGDASSVSFAIKGDTKISDQLTGFGYSEWKTKNSKIESIENENVNKLAYAGLKIANFGSLDYGRNYGILYEVNAWTDVLPLYSADSMSCIDNFMTGRGRNLLTYRNTNFFGLVDGLNLAIQYQGKNTLSNKTSSSNYLKNNGDGFGLATNYDIGFGLKVGGGYSRSNHNLVNLQKAPYKVSGKSAEGWNAAIKYDADNLYLAAMYGETHNTTRIGRLIGDNDDTRHNVNKTENIELVAQYLFDELNLKSSIAYLQSKGKDLIDLEYSTNQNLKKYISLGAFYYFNKNITATVDYKINLIKKTNFSKKYAVNSNNIIGLGLVYKF
ncbi:MAG: porin [Arsenophonus sp. ET-DL12-MAG3]